MQKYTHIYSYVCAYVHARVKKVNIFTNVLYGFFKLYSKDYMKDCSAMFKAGDCEESPSVMLEACPQSCGFCTPKTDRLIHDL